MRKLTSCVSGISNDVHPHSVARGPLVLLTLLVAAFAARLGVRIAFGQEYFWTNSYAIYYSLAENIVAGKGFCLASQCAWLPPLYPLFLIPSVLAGKSFLLIVVPEALFGAGTAWCAFLIGREIFDQRVGLLACAMTALYPYYVMHDTALQDTGLMTFLTALSVYLLLRARRLNGNFDWFFPGISLGTIALLRDSGVPVIAVGLLWCLVWGASGTVFAVLRKTAILALAVLLILGPWLVETYRLTGIPVITVRNGIALWTGNNPYTFSHYPAESIDRSRTEAFRNLSAADQTELNRLRNDASAMSTWYYHRALEFISAHPALVADGALRKIAAAFSWRLNPLRERLAQILYFIGYVPIAVLGIIGMILTGPRREVILIAMLFLAFIVVTAVFWAHTSHRTYLDIYWIIFTAAVIERIWTEWRRRDNPLLSEPCLWTRQRYGKHPRATPPMHPPRQIEHVPFRLLPGAPSPTR